MRYKAPRKLGPEDAAYLAGLIDGEGTVTSSRRHANERRQLVVSISSTEPDLLHWAATATGVGKITRKRGVSDKHSPGLTYCVTIRQTPAVLAQVAPFLRSYKKLRAELALEQYVALTPRNGKYTVAATEARLLFERAFLRIVPATRVRPNPFT